MTTISPDAYDRASELLATHPNFRVLRRLRPVSRFHDAKAVGETYIGVAVDVETTGLNYETDKIIELAVQRFRYDKAGHILEVGQPRVW